MSNDDIEIIKGWHLRKEVTVGQILTLLTILIAGVAWANSVEMRLSSSEYELKRVEQKLNITIGNINDRFDRYQRQIEAAMVRIENKLDLINSKVDSKVDKDDLH